MTETANLGLPFIDGSQAQKHVTHNEALRILDDAIQIAVRDTTLTAPPASPADGERHIVAGGATGAWAGQGDTVATWETNAWRFLPPKAGWCVWSVADDALLVFDGGAWVPMTAGSGSPFSPDNLPHLGINATVAGSNLLTVHSNDALFSAISATDGGSGDVRLQLSKSAAGNTSSVVFSDAFSGRAEFGLTGDDDFHLKVSADGTSWRDALRFDRATGRVSFPSGGAREILAAGRTYHVDGTNGDDGNDGLAGGLGHAFQTLQKAYDVIAGTLDLSGHAVTIQLADGTYAPSGGVSALLVGKSWTGGGAIIIQGNAATPASVVLSTASANAVDVTVTPPGNLTVKDLKIQTATAGDGVALAAPGLLNIGNLNFGACAGSHVNVNAAGANVSALSGYAVSGSAAVHVNVNGQSKFTANASTVTLSGTPNFSVRFVNALGAGYADFSAASFSGAATGQRYGAFINGMIFSNGGSATFFPGSVAGTTGTGGQYN